eukprot:TRINITY_DN11254_c0_g2_i1.p1 TRINITY_DN11254_c0_g2~~TRINITY_DN11254_c0_g2_i1.p1  ORF type:complete len:747 (+),score=278.59 TRINITY_DN11254_c0_g2_i1:47-2287(+)
MTEFTSMLVSPEKVLNEGVNAATVAQEWVSEHMLKKQGDKEAEAKMNRQVAERLALELRTKCETVEGLKGRIRVLEKQLQSEATVAAEVHPLKNKVLGFEHANVELHSSMMEKDAAINERDARISENQDRLLDAEAENTTLRKAISVQEQQLEEREATISKQKESYQHLLGISRKVATQNQVLNTEAERLGSIVPTLQRECEHLKEQAKVNDSLRQEADRLTSLAQMVPRLTEELGTARESAQQVQTLEEERQLLIQACQQMSDEIPKLNKQIEELHKENASLPLLREETTRLENIIQSLESELVKNKMLEQEVDRLHAALQDAALIKKEFEKVSKDLQRIPALEAELRSAMSLAEEVPGLVSLRDHLSRAVDEKEAELKQYRTATGTELETMKKEIDSMRKENVQTKMKMRELEGENEQKDMLAGHQLKTIAEPLAAEAKSLKQLVTNLEQQLQQQGHSHKEEMSRLLATLEIEKASVRKQVDDREKHALTEIKEKDAIITQLRMELSEPTVAVTEQDTSDVEMLRHELEEEKKTVETQKTAASTHKQAAEEKDDEIAKLQTELKEKQQENEDLCTKLKLTMKGMDSLQSNEREKELEKEVKRQEALIKSLSAVKEVPTVPHSSPSRNVSPCYPVKVRSVSQQPVQPPKPPQVVPNSRSISPTRIRSMSPPATESPKVAPPRYSPSAIAPHPAEIQVLRTHLNSANPDVPLAAAEADALGYHGTSYWSENNCRRAKVWMAMPPTL